MSIDETCARAAYEMRRAVVQHRAAKLSFAHVSERAFRPWDALPFAMREQFIAQTKGSFDAHGDVFDRFFVGAATMTRNMLAELSPPMVCEPPAPPPPRPEAA